MGQTFPIVPPRSRILVIGCTRTWAGDRIAAGAFPRGSIWFPGSLTKRPEIGDLYGPDPTWTAVDPKAGRPAPDEFTEPVVLVRDTTAWQKQ